METTRINVTFNIEDYKTIKLLAHKQNKSMGELVREWALQGLNGKLTENNLDVIAPVLRRQIESVLTPQMERMISLTAKTCIQAGAAAYLSADAILKFVPVPQREEVAESYEAARKKAIAYMKNNTNINL